MVADIGNAYLNTPCREKMYFTAGAELDAKKEQCIVVVQALYGLKTSGAAWRAFLAQAIYDLRFKSGKADPDLLMKPGVKNDGTAYWKYVLIYVGGILYMSHVPAIVVECISKLCRLKEDPKTRNNYSEPKTYLGYDIDKFNFSEGRKSAWYMSSDSYIKSAVNAVEEKLHKEGLNLLKAKNTSTPISPGYCPELDVTDELHDEWANHYHNLIGVLRWAVGLGWIDIHVEVKYNRSKIVFDDMDCNWKQKFITQDLKNFYPDAKGEIPLDMPEAYGNSVQINTFVDATMLEI
eukprot:15364566-Ditylum_brightwellii.AAC.1